MSVHAAHAALSGQAIKASGALVRVEPEEFQRLMNRVPEPLIIVRQSRFFGERYEYMVGYKGLVFYTKTRSPLPLPGRAEVIAAKSIWLPPL